MLSRLRPLLTRQAAILSARRMVRLPTGFPPTVSFTFDDFPHSAYGFGFPVLQRAGLPATWYTAVSLLGQPSASGIVAPAQAVIDLHQAGHEIACHTWGHLKATETRAQHYSDDIARNRAALAHVLPGVAVRSFAYPFGAVTASAKRAALAQATTCRGTRPGIVRGRVDLGLLPANRLYSAAAPLSAVERLIADIRSGGGWAILYTHDVAPEPSPWGCTPGYLAAVVAAVIQAGLAVRTVGDVAAQLAPFQFAADLTQA